MDTIVVYSQYQSSRLTYVLDWLLKERLQLDYRIVIEEEDIKGAANVICYLCAIDGAVNIPDIGFMVDAAPGNTPKEIPCTWLDWNGLPTLFHTGYDNEQDVPYTIPFDIFSAIFYLLSRYEEYLPYTADKHGRYPATESMLYKQGMLQRPIVDEWVEAFRQQLQKTWDTEIPAPSFSFQPSYDIDMAYSHAYKGIKRIVGAYIRALLKGDVEGITERTQVLKKRVIDPYDSFAWLRHLHEQHGYKPLYFVLSALRTTPFDKNIHPRHPAMIRVIKQLAKEGRIGIHPSYYATQYDVLAKENNTLKSIINQPITLSRQHYIKLVIPTTYHLLMDNDLTDDYSMGYGSHLGFRAGTGSSFLWYDLIKEKTTPIRTHPFCFMDTTAHYEMGLSVEQAFATLNAMRHILQQCGSTLVTVFHNFSLGTDQEWTGWNEAYGEFMGS